MKYYKLQLVICFILSVCQFACNDDPTRPVYVDNIVDESDLQIDKQIIVSGDDPLLIKTSQATFQKSDWLLLRKKGSLLEMKLDWGYEYLGLDESGERAYDYKSVVAKIDFDDKWEYGVWEIILQRDDRRQIIADAEFVILTLKSDEEDPEVFVDMSDLYKRNIYLYAKGWQNADMDTIEFVNRYTKEIVLRKGSPASAQTEDYSEVLLNFNADELETGSYTVNICRWQYHFKQALFDFDYFKIALVDEEPILIDKDGKYYIKFYLDEIVTGDKVRVSYGGGKTQYFDETLEEEYFDEATNIYTIYIPENKLFFGNTYTVSLTRKGTAMTLGAKILPEEN